MAQAPLDPWGRPLRTSQSKVSTNAFKQVAGRLWYLAIPLLGIICSQDAYVRPHLLNDENTINLEKLHTEQRVDSLLADLRIIDAETAAVQAEIDSTWQPQVVLYSTVLDSLVRIRREFDAAIPADEAKIDSMKAVLSELNGQLQSASAELQGYQITIDGLKDERRTLRDSLDIVSNDIEELAGVYDRMANPDDYRKNTALIPGPGNYPNRDALEK